ncbi:hypothetical protein ABPG74_016449 [Tetrahymena malaccensis]
MNRRNQRVFSCFCGNGISYEDEANLKNHIQRCDRYQKESPFFRFFSSLDLKQLPEVHLVAIKSEFLSYVDAVVQELQNKGYNPNQVNQIQNFQPNVNTFNNSESRMQSSMFSSRIIPQKHFISSDQVQCQGCKKGFDSNFDSDKIYYLNLCLHPFCKGCLIKQINTDFVNKAGVSCLTCNRDLVEYDYNNLIGKEKYEQLEQKMIQKMYNLVSCVKCKAQFEFVSGSAGQNVRDNNGQLLPPQLQQHYAENRFVCQNSECKQEQCRNCQAFPYHLGYNCENYRQFKQSKRCRYCDETITQINTNQPLALQDICSKEECVSKKKYTCQKINNCNHPCYGIKDELECLPCLHPDCAKNNADLRDNDSDQYCNICWSEGLGAGPCVQLGCKHIFHYECLKKRLDVKWISARIVFNFCFCPLCKQWMEFSLDCDLNNEMQKMLALYENIKKKSLDRLKFEERLKDEKLNDPHSPYYNQPQEYAMAIYAYFMCFKCKKPYFGGLKDCQRGLDEDKREFDPKELVCANCCEIPVENCPKHGKDYIEFKCKFCCSVAQWFCWGTTHFCEPCHKRQCNGDYVSKYPKEKLPKCAGGTKCPVGGSHKPNGEESALGCSLCRNAKDNQKEF